MVHRNLLLMNIRICWLKKYWEPGILLLLLLLVFNVCIIYNIKRVLNWGGDKKYWIHENEIWRGNFIINKKYTMLIKKKIYRHKCKHAI